MNDEICRLEREGICICGNYRAAFNTATKTDLYPIPRIDDINCTLNGGQVFSKIDGSNAYLQCRLHVDYRKYTNNKTHIGLFQYTRLPFGVSSAPAIYHRVMDNMLNSIPGVCDYLDDVLISGSTEQEHLDKLNRVWH